MSKTILIVDDSTTFRQVVRMALASAGYEVIEAHDGKHALSKLDGRKVHVIVSDVNMPVMDGINFAKQAKDLPAYKFTPIIMLTTESSDTRKQEGKSAGVKAWMVKPFKPDQLLTAIKKLAMP